MTENPLASGKEWPEEPPTLRSSMVPFPGTPWPQPLDPWNPPRIPVDPVAPAPVFPTPSPLGEEFFKKGPLAVDCGVRRPYPGERGYFYHKDTRVLNAGTVERYEYEPDEEEPYVMVLMHACAPDSPLEAFRVEQSFYWPQDADAYARKENESADRSDDSTG